MNPRAQKLLLLAFGITVLAFIAQVLEQRSLNPAPVGSAGQSLKPLLHLVFTRESESGDIAIEQARLVSSALLPIPAVNGDIVGLYNNGEPVAASPIRFAAYGIVDHGRDGDVYSSSKLALDQLSGAVYVPYETFDELRVVNFKGETQFTTTRAAIDQLLPSSATDQRPASTRRSLQTLRLAYPHIRFVTNQDQLPTAFSGGLVTGVVDYSGYWVDVLSKALAELTETQLSAVSTLAVVTMNDAGVIEQTACDGTMQKRALRGGAIGSHIFINSQAVFGTDVRRAGPRVIARDLARFSTAAYVQLVEPIAQLRAEQLPDALRRRVNHARRSYRTHYGMPSLLWAPLQRVASDLDETVANYAGAEGDCEYPNTAASSSAGFAAPFGARGVREDIATYLELFASDPITISEHPVCREFQNVQADVPPELVLRFAKLTLLRGLELITEKKYQRCIGDTDPANKATLHIAGEDYSEGYSVQTTDLGRNELLAVVGRFGQSEALLQLLVSYQQITPDGVYRLDNQSPLYSPFLDDLRRRHFLTLAEPDENGTVQKLTSSTGFMLVTDTPQQTKGYAFLLALQDPQGRETDILDMIWFRIDKK